MMEKKTLRRIKLLTGIILLIFFIPSGTEFIRGFSAGWQSVDKEIELTGEKGDHHLRSFIVELRPVSGREVSRELEEDCFFIPYDESGQLIIPQEQAGSAWWVAILSTLASLVGVILLIWFVVLLFRFFAKLGKRRIMGEENIDSIQLMAYVLGAFSLTHYLMRVIEAIWLNSHLDLEGYRVVLQTPPSSLIIALLLLVAAEILKLGNQLQEEQDLTI